MTQTLEADLREALTGFDIDLPHALRRHDGALDRYVFLGSEGEAFTVTKSIHDLIAIPTMGYPTIEERGDLSASPEYVRDEIHEGEWPEPVEVKAWVFAHLCLDHPMAAVGLPPHLTGAAPFKAFVAQQAGLTV